MTSRLKVEPNKWALWFSGDKESLWMQDGEGCVYVFDSKEDAERVCDELYTGEEDIEARIFFDDTLCTKPFFDTDRSGWDFD